MRLCNERSPRAMHSTNTTSSVASSTKVARAARGVGRVASPSSEASAHSISLFMATNKTGGRNTYGERVERCWEGVQDQEQTQVLPCCCSCGAEKEGDRAPTRSSLQRCRPHPARFARTVMPMFVIDSDSSSAALPQHGEGINKCVDMCARTTSEVDNIGDLQCQSTPATIGSSASEGAHRRTCLTAGEGQGRGGEGNQDYFPSVLVGVNSHSLES